VNKSINISK